MLLATSGAELLGYGDGLTRRDYPATTQVGGPIGHPGDLLAVSVTNLQGVYLDPGDRPLMERLRVEVHTDGPKSEQEIQRGEDRPA